MEEEYSRRRRNGIAWQMVNKGFAGSEQVTVGFTVDDLDTKKFSDAETQYERVFVLIREVLEQNSSSCMDVEEERLNCCQEVADTLKKFLKF